MSEKKRKLVIGVVIVLSALVFLFFMDNNQEEIEIDFDSMTMKEKISQMIIVKPGSYEKSFSELEPGGIFLNEFDNSWRYKQIISKYKRNMKIRPFVSTDMEGYWNPFEDFYKSKSFAEINNSEESYLLGKEHGRILSELGFNLNFAPVAEFKDMAYGGRAFRGNKTEIQKMLISYIKGLHEKRVYATCKHYPGKGMIKDLHVQKDIRNISKRDLELFETCFKNNVSFIMVGHQIVKGEINSKGKPASVSEEVFSSIPDDVLVISDEINMKGLDSEYSSKIEKYADLINTGNDIILDFELQSENYSYFIDSLEEEVKRGNINETEINKSVKKILMYKDYDIKNA